MEVHLFSTEKIVHLDGVPARIWEGTTVSGIKVHVYITRIACDKDDPGIEEFHKELQEQRPPSVEVNALPLRLLL